MRLVPLVDYDENTDSNSESMMDQESGLSLGVFVFATSFTNASHRPILTGVPNDGYSLGHFGERR
ncbi:MAG TPA: hypothetical protein VN833_13250 [Candidatus Acidoferrales bacterium]|nr:hypothetical protein [Candidatus Acidoferrales bacterium]